MMPKMKLEDVLFVAPERGEWQGNVYWKAKFVDDKGDYSQLLVQVDTDKLADLPAPRTRCNAVCDVVQRNNKTYIQNPVITTLKTS